jgi:predicted transcriptional regulator
MTKQNYSFRLSMEKIAKLDKLAALDDRDRTYMVDKAIDLYLKTHAEKNGTEPHPKPTKKKAGAR